MMRRSLARLLIGLLLVMLVPPPRAEAAAVKPSDVLLNVAAHRPDLLVIIHTQDELIQINVDAVVRSWMVTVIAQGGWLVTTKTPVAFGANAQNVGTPWIILKHPAEGFYLNYDVYPAGGGDPNPAPGIAESFDSASIASFGAALAAIGGAIAATGEALGPKGKAVKAFGLGVAAIGGTLEAYGLLATPKQGHVDTPAGPTGMPAAGGPPGSDPNGPTGQSPPGQPSNANGNTPSGGADGAGGDTGGEGDVGEQ
jgi:hypothetical protein